jgi:hypothetical protein
MKRPYDINDPENEDLIISESMDNAYRMITLKDTYDSLHKSRGRVFMLFNPVEGSKEDTDLLIDTLIDYYSDESLEEYEKCAELLKVKRSKKFVFSDLLM